MISDEQRRQAEEALEQLAQARHSGAPMDFSGQVRRESRVYTAPGPGGPNAESSPRAASHPPGIPRQTVVQPRTVQQQASVSVAQAPAAGAEVIDQGPARGPLATIATNVLSRYGWIIVIGVGAAAWWWISRNRRKR
jgi:hypothetical protein